MSHILPRVDNQLKKYQEDHSGDVPLYILVSPYEVDELLKEVREISGYDPDVLVTNYKGSQIVKQDSFQKGEMLLSNELPETSA